MFNDENDCELFGEFEIKINDLIQNELKARMGQAVTDLEKYKGKNESQRDEIVELRRQLREQKREYDADLKKALREKENEVKRQLFDGFTLGDPCYVIGSNMTRTKCDKCGGTGKVIVPILGEEKQVTCPYCSAGVIVTFDYFPKQEKITTIRLEINDRGGRWLSFWSGDHEHSSERVYKTIEECQAVCGEKNDKSAK